MAYEKQTWIDNETPLNAEHMNHIEDGIKGLDDKFETNGNNDALSLILASSTDGSTKRFRITIDDNGELTKEEIFNIYGVSWNISASNVLSRTDDAVVLAEPVPCVNGVGGSSPFDSIMPWAGMEVVEDATAGSMVAIPKYYYKISKADGKLNIQISPGAAPGFSVSPAHADRGDGKGERDVVYISRYHMGATSYKSVSGELPLTSVPRETLRTALTAELGYTSEYSQQDYAMFWTIRMLMVVEYATWDFQGAIGYGCGNGSEAEVSGSTDSMPYHTGTVSASKETYGVGVQYRYIEDMWANVAEWIDGWYVVANEETGLFDVYVITNPTAFSDTEGGVKIGTINPDTMVGFISDWAVPTVEGYDWAMIPAATCMDESQLVYGNEFVADFCVFVGPALLSGGSFDVCAPLYGPFFLSAAPVGSAAPDFGARLQKIP